MAYDTFKSFTKEWAKKVDSVIESFIESKRNIMNSFGEINSAAWEYTRDFTLGGGKRIRPVLFIAGFLSRNDNIDPEYLNVAAALELLHAFLLIHDDIEDRDELRRGKPTVWKRFEDGFSVSRHVAYSLAINTGDIVYTWVSQLILNSDLDEETKVFALKKILEVAEHTAFGQNVDVMLAENDIEGVTIDDVMLVYRQKTGIYTIAAPLTLGMRMGGGWTEDELKQIWDAGMKVGIAFQMRDDIIGLIGNPEVTGKPVGSDLREGKKTYVLLLAYRRMDNSGKRKVKELLGKEDPEAVEALLDMIKETGAIEDVQREAEVLVEEAKEVFRDTSMDSKIRKVLLELSDYVVKREK